jgi:hypothetical protein
VGRVSYEEPLDRPTGTFLYVEFRTKGPDVLDYSLILVIGVPLTTETVHVYDAAHGFNEMHRFTRSDGKQQGVRFHPGTLGEGMRMAMVAIKSGFRPMIEGWERG